MRDSSDRVLSPSKGRRGRDESGVVTRQLRTIERRKRKFRFYRERGNERKIGVCTLFRVSFHHHGDLLQKTSLSSPTRSTALNESLVGSVQAEPAKRRREENVSRVC